MGGARTDSQAEPEGRYVVRGYVPRWNCSGASNKVELWMTVGKTERRGMAACVRANIDCTISIELDDREWRWRVVGVTKRTTSYKQIQSSWKSLTPPLHEI